MNKAILLGRLTKDPELATTTSGISVCNFTLAISRRFANANGDKETDFINIVTWKNTADNCHKYLKKGSQVSLVGSIQTRSYEAQDKTKRYVTEVVADEVEFIGSKNTNTTDENKPTETLTPVPDNQLPF